jgi:hypothetical protein
LKSHQSSTQKQFSQGDKREDGFIFKQYSKRKREKGFVLVEQWLSPESYQRAKIGAVAGNCRRRANSTSIPYNLDIDYLESIYPKDNKCPIFGIELEWGLENGHNNSPSLDRIHPALGYVKGNVIWISNRQKDQRKSYLV